ncbi:uncharacterized protein LOC115376967 [Myripristis murdjan]|uniref:uncharacterized protein LOC115376967 n=1 Tax=Myripristis murdjan TaxID=586833 RepID=UPI001175F2EE|nr:uncharacterized protein LOC115376967 [Myripristis murdjan]
MAHVKSVSILLIITWFLPVLSAEALNLKVQPGDDVTLSCQAPDVNIEAAEWSRTDLKKEEYVFFYQDGHIDSVKQHPSFKNRVEVKDKEMKNGNLSVILKNVTKNDSGTYECRFKTENVESNITEAKPTSTIELEVVDPDPGATEEQDESPAEETARLGQHDETNVVVIVIVVVVIVVVLLQRLAPQPPDALEGQRSDSETRGTQGRENHERPLSRPVGSPLLTTGIGLRMRMLPGGSRGASGPTEDRHIPMKVRQLLPGLPGLSSPL